MELRWALNLQLLLKLLGVGVAPAGHQHAGDHCHESAHKNCQPEAVKGVEFIKVCARNDDLQHCTSPEEQGDADQSLAVAGRDHLKAENA